MASTAPEARVESPSHAPAGSPLGRLRRQIEAQLSAIAASTAAAERELTEAAVRRANTAQSLAENDATREQLLADVAFAPVNVLVRTLHDGLALRAERAEIEERIAALRQRLSHLGREQTVLEHVLRTLEDAAGSGVPVDLRSARLSQASRRIFQIVDDEHEAMASSILDGPMQRLSDAAMNAELAGHVLPWDTALAAESVTRCRDATVEAATGLQRRIERLWPIDSEQSLAQAMRQLIADVSMRKAVQLRVMGGERRLHPLAELAAYRIVEAAIDNALRHGNAAHVDVVLSFHRDRAGVVIKDDGEGFDVIAAEAQLGRTRGLGMIQMHERASLAGGRLEVRSQMGAGTEVRLTLPVAT